MHASDGELLNRFGTEADHEAFAELVRRHLPAVSATARRIVMDPVAAEDVAQVVFTRLAQRWRRVPRRCVLGAWLHADTRLVALQHLRSERRRQLREQTAVLDANALEPEPPDWAAIRPLLDESLERLAEADRDVIVMRYLEPSSLDEVARRLGLKEDAARMRVHRALERMRVCLEKRHVATTTAALSSVLTTYGALPVPLSVSQTVAGLAMATSHSALLSAGTGSLLSPLLMNKALPWVGAVLVAALTADVVLQRWENARLQQATNQLMKEVDTLREDQANGLSNSSLLAAEQARTKALAQELEALRRRSPPSTDGMSNQPMGVLAASQTGDIAAKEVPQGGGPSLTEEEVAQFLQLPEAEQARLLAVQRFAPGILTPAVGDPAQIARDFLKARELAGRVRLDLNALEDSPARFADFQSAFIQSVIGLGDADRQTRIRGVIENAYQQAVRDGLTASKAPPEGIREWALRRDELDRRATKEVQALLNEEERGRFDQAFMGVVGIDLGVGDGKWFRFSRPDGSVVFPSEGDPLPAGEKRSPESP